MKSLSEYFIESTNVDIKKLEKNLDKVEEKVEEANKSEETIKDEKSFREAAKAKFEEVFGDDLDEDRMNDVIDGLLKDNKELVDSNEWAELIGMLNASFAK